ncbi:hypothetical protein [Kitasatospora sp. NPDC002040]|uniref:hypothetical protein n=1 Tax=Kitasatospora sp. NPDC002040 TaxID=3154661 RepID=UPI003321B5C5
MPHIPLADCKAVARAAAHTSRTTESGREDMRHPARSGRALSALACAALAVAVLTACTGSPLSSGPSSTTQSPPSRAVQRWWHDDGGRQSILELNKTVKAVGDSLGTSNGQIWDACAALRDTVKRMRTTTPVPDSELADHWNGALDDFQGMAEMCVEESEADSEEDRTRFEAHYRTGLQHLVAIAQRVTGKQ